MNVRSIITKRLAELNLTKFEHLAPDLEAEIEPLLVERAKKLVSPRLLKRVLGQTLKLSQSTKKDDDDPRQLTLF